MFFASPLWLFALLPWVGGVFWLLWGRRRKTLVPFLELWRGPALQPPVKRALQPPPIFLALAMLATLLTILAAGQPRIRSQHGDSGNPVTIIVDRGISMSATTGGVPRFVMAAKEADKAIKQVLEANTPVDLDVLPGKAVIATRIADWAAVEERTLPTAVDTQPILVETIRDRLANSPGAVIVISDRQLPGENFRLIQFSPTDAVNNIGIVQMAARETPSPQVMVRLRNDGDERSVPLTIMSGSQQARQIVDLPPRGQERNYFIDLAKFDAVIEAAVEAKDDQPADDRAWLVREGSFPRIQPRTPLSPEVRRIIEVYTRTRPPTDGSQTVAVVCSETNLPDKDPAVWIAPATGPTARGTVNVTSHPVTANINWSVLGAEVQTAGDPPRGWTPLVRVGPRVIVAASVEPPRRIWIGFDAPSWPAAPDFVVFWANVFTWLGQGQERFAAYPLAEYDSTWKPAEATDAKAAAEPGMWPGIYRTDEGVQRAYNASLAEHGKGTSATADWRPRLLAARELTKTAYDLSPAMLIAALACLVGAATTWKRTTVVKVRI